MPQPCHNAPAIVKLHYLWKRSSQCLLSVVFEHWGIDVAEGLEKQMHYHGRYEKRKRRNLWEKFFALA